MEETETQRVCLHRMKKSEADKYTHLWTLLALFLTILPVKHLLELLLHLYFHFLLAGGGCFPLQNRSFLRKTSGRGSALGVGRVRGLRNHLPVAVRCQMDGCTGSSGSGCPTVTASAGASTWAPVPAENNSSSPAFRYVQADTGLVHPNLSLGTERGVRWVGRDPGLVHRSEQGQLQAGIGPLLETLPSQVVSFSEGWRSWWSSGPVVKSLATLVLNNNKKWILYLMRLSFAATCVCCLMSFFSELLVLSPL